MDLLFYLKDKQNRFGQLTTQYSNFAMWVSWSCAFLAGFHAYIDFNRYGIHHPLGYLPIVATTLLVGFAIWYKLVPHFKYKNIVFEAVMFSYLAIKLYAFNQPVPPTAIWLVLFPIFAAYTISLVAHTLFFIGSILLILTNFFWQTSIVHHTSITATRDLSNYLMVSVILYFFTRFVVRNEERSYNLLENKISENSHIATLSSLGEMSGAIAHEISNPLQILLGVNKLLGKKIEEEETIETSQLRSIYTSATNALERINNVIQSMLNLTKSEQIERRKTNFSHIYSLFYPLVKNRMLNHNIQFQFDQHNELVEEPIWCNPESVAQAIINLINNAVDAIIDHNSPWIKLELHSDQNGYHISLIDSGDGIKSSIRQRMFEPFFTTKGVNQGTGLGLSLIYRMITDQDGSIRYHLNEGNTCFTITLPHYATEQLSAA